MAKTECRHDPLTSPLDELRKSDIVDVVIETCATKIFLANPDMDQELYRNQFHLNEKEIDLISTLVPKRQFLIKNHDIAKVAEPRVVPEKLLAVHQRPV